MELSSYHKFLIVSIVAIVYTDVPQYMYRPDGIPPKYWFIGLYLLSLPVLVIQKNVWNLLKSPLTIWCFGYAGLAMLWFLLSSQSDIAWQEVRLRFLAISQLLVFLMIFQGRNAIELARKALVAGVLFSVSVNIYEIFAPMSFSNVMGRSAGLYVNPNIAGEALVLGMILCITVLAPRYRGPFFLVVGAGILVTLSRAAIVMWIIAAICLIFTRKLRLKDLLFTGAIGLLLAAVVLLPRLDELLNSWERNGVVNVDVLERLEWLSDPAGVSDYSSWERKYLAQRAWDKVSERPFLGNGTGSSYELYTATHNQYLALMIDHGLIGVLIVPGLILAVAWGSRGETRHLAIVFGCAILMLCLFSHTILSDGYSLLLFTLMAAMTSTSQHRYAHNMVRKLTGEQSGEDLMESQLGYGPQSQLTKGVV